MTIAEQLNSVSQIKNDIKTVLLNSGVDMTDVSFAEYADIISDLSTTDISKTKFGISLASFINADNKTNLTFTGTGIKDIKDYALQGAFSGKSGIKTANFPDLTKISGTRACYNTFRGNLNLTTVNMPKLTTLSGIYCCAEMFRDVAPSLNHIDLSALTEVSGLNACSEMFRNCYGLSSINLDNLTMISGEFAFYYAFYGCTWLPTISFPKLTTISNTDAFTGTFNNCTALTEIHFRYDMKEIVEGLDGYSEKFGATNATIYFDLGDKVDVTIEPTPDNATVTFYQDDVIVPNPKDEVPLYGWVAGNTTYYTKTATPTIGDLIYNADGNPTGQVITAAENNTITIE
jgi:hypothetical protein